MKKIVTLMCLSAFMAIGTSLSAQSYLRHSIFLNGNLPTGDFGRRVSTSHSTVPLTVTEIGKDASIGFGLGYRISYHFDVGVGNVAPFAGFDFLWNTIGGGWGDKYSNAYYNTPTYFNIPLLGGVSYIYDELPWNEIKAFGEFGIGTDFFWITSEGKGGVEGGDRYYYKASFAFAWMIGAGAFFGDHVSAGLYYYSLGKHNIDYTDNTAKNNPNASAQLALPTFERQRRTVGSVMLRIGFHF